MNKFIIVVINKYDKYNEQKTLFFIHKNEEKFTLNIDEAFIGNSFEAIKKVNKEIEDDKFYGTKYYIYEIINIKDINNE